MESLLFAILSPASSIRHRVRYSIGDTPTVSLSLSAKVDRDKPARCPNCSTVQCHYAVLFRSLSRQGLDYGDVLHQVLGQAVALL